MKLATRIVLVSLIIIAAALFCAAQQRPPQSDQPNSVTIDETFDLNIAERHITETNFVASTAVGFTRDNVSMKVGVELRAGKIDVLLHNVTGTVRFRGSVQRILDVINSRPGAPRP